MKVRTRVAPSPTGDPHVGTAYVALINFCAARKGDGEFVLRIEDTDRARSTQASEAAILDSLHWLGLSWDEGPDVGGPHGPYRQSERSAIYRDHVERLLAEGHAFTCFCTPERLEEMRVAQQAAKQPPHYDGHCLTLEPQEVEASLAARIPHVVRMKIPPEGVCVFEDELRGRIEIDWRSVDMQVLLKSDGLPTYHLANVVDDHLMEITHVIRGEEWVSSAPKHVLLYRYFGWEPPRFAHLPLLRNPDKSKLSKRKNPTSILYYRERGFLAKAVLHFLGSLADSGNDDRLFEAHDLLLAMWQRFDVHHISLGGPVFDTSKLRWLNGQHIRRLSVAQFLETLGEWGFVWPASVPAEHREHIARVAQSRIETLADFSALIEFFAEMPPVSKADLLHERLQAGEAKSALDAARKELASIPEGEWHESNIGAHLKKVAEDVLKMRFRDVARLYYVAITGSPTSVPLFDAMEILGKSESLRRLRTALEELH
ncbi:MAG TPA: glutamate--tRNA ligase [Candidatus Tyrphobacter sp.]